VSNIQVFYFSFDTIRYFMFRVALFFLNNSRGFRCNNVVGAMHGYMSRSMRDMTENDEELLESPSTTSFSSSE
jgi:hypothetical protein